MCAWTAWGQGGLEAKLVDHLFHCCKSHSVVGFFSLLGAKSIQSNSLSYVTYIYSLTCSDL